jgi:four helix bundle protein
VRRQGIKDFPELRVWQLSMDLAEAIYRETQQFPGHEQFGLVSQLRRAAVSVPSNIAEGHTRNQTGEYLRFLAMARGSLAEVKTQLLLSERLGYMPEPAARALVDKTMDLLRQVTSLRSAIEKRAQGETR